MLGAAVRWDEGPPRRASDPKPHPRPGRRGPRREAPAQRPARHSGTGPQDGAGLRCSGEALCPRPAPATPPRPSGELTLPHGHGQDGSPGLEAFHRAKSLGDRFSLRRSAEMLRSPVDMGDGSLPLPAPPSGCAPLSVVEPALQLAACPGFAAAAVRRL